MANEERTGVSLLIGISVGLVMACMAGSAAGYVIKRNIQHRADDWRLTPVVVAAVDIDEGTVVTFDMISQRAVPGRFVTRSVVKPDSASYVVNEAIHAPLKTGDPLLWPQFADHRCGDELEELAKAHGQSPDVAAFIAKVRNRLRAKSENGGTF